MKVKYVLILCAIFFVLGFISAFQIQNKIPSLSPSSLGSEEAVSQKFELQGKVTRIIDGDTMEVNGIKVRLALVNTPERGQSGFIEATQFTATLCPVGSVASVDQDDGQPWDTYGRMVAVVYCGGKNLNAELWKNGYARIDEQFLAVSEFDPYLWS